MNESGRLRCGELEAEWDVSDGSLRYIRYRGEELVRAIYGAVRDRNWRTVPAAVLNVQRIEQERRFAIRFECVHRDKDISFVWSGRIEGDDSGSLRFEFSGSAERSFWRNRIGLCVLLPPELAGTIAVVFTPEGRCEAQVPVHIAPHQPMKRINGLQFQPSERLKAKLEFTGELFEMEDQRNWTDASFKIYGTPLELDYPVLVHTGQSVRQAVALKVSKCALFRSMTIDGHRQGQPHEATPDSTVRDEGQRSLRRVPDSPLLEGKQFAAADECVPVPAIGLELSGAARNAPGLEDGLGEAAERLLDALQPSHLHTVVLTDKAGWRERLGRAIAWSNRLNVKLSLEAAIDAEASDAGELIGLLAAKQASVARLAVFPLGFEATGPREIDRVREEAARHRMTFPIGGGTRAYFAELNRAELPADLMDFVTYTVNPQVHAFDDRSLLETTAMHAVTLRNAVRLGGNKPVCVGPVTMKPRLNPNSTDGRQPDTTERIDVRQHSLFGAAWTLASMASFSLAGAAALTYFETFGPLGVIREDGQGVYPVYHVIADINEWKDAAARKAECGSTAVVSIALARGGSLRVLVANTTAGNVTARVQLGCGNSEAYVRMLDESSCAAATGQPLVYRGEQSRYAAAEGVVEVELSAYAYACVDTVPLADAP